jgi:4,5-DOPA dioxygenase extradiol
MKINDLTNLTGKFSNTEKMPALFLGHGSPMNAIDENQFVAGVRNIAKELPYELSCKKAQQN